MKSLSQRDICTLVITEALFVVYIFKIDYSAVNKKKILPFVTTSMDPECFTLSEIIQRQIPYNLKTSNSWRQRAEGWEDWGDIVQRVQTSRYGTSIVWRGDCGEHRAVHLRAARRARLQRSHHDNKTLIM